MVGQAASMKARSRPAASGAGSHAVTERPRARKWVAQLAPIVPVPSSAIEPTSVGAGRAMGGLLPSPADRT